MTRPRFPLKAIFSPTRRLVDPARTLLQRGGLLGGVQMVVPRAELTYRRLDFSALPARQRASAARIAILQVQPARTTQSRIAWKDGIAHVWSWVPPDARPPRAPWVPESLLIRPPASADATRLVGLARGVEGQVWQGGQLLASRWWPEKPDAAAWHRFLRSAGLGAEGAPPEIEAIPPGLPWALLKDRGTASTQTTERIAWRVALGGLAVALGWQWAARDVWRAAQADLETRTRAARIATAPLLDARERAETARAATERYASLRQMTSDYMLMAQVIAPLPPESKLMVWQRQGTKLLAGVQAPESDPRKFVAAYERSPLLSDAKATLVDTGQMRLEFELPKPAASGDPG